MSPRTLFRALTVGIAATMAFAFGPQAVAAPVTTPAAPTVPSKAPKLPKDAKTVPNRWIVQVSGAATADGGSATAAKASQDQVLTTAGSEGLGVRRTASFTTAYNGMTVTASSADADQLRNVAGVIGVWPVIQVAAPNPVVNNTKDLMSALAMTGADAAYSELGYTGQGIKVGVIDSGIDIDHPDLGGTGTPGTTPFPSSRVKWGYDFVGDAYYPDSATNPVDTPTPDPIPDDCNGHGTHVAGIIGANGNFATGGVRGVAPKVTFGAYRVFGCEGATSNDILLAAMDRAISDHMDVVNMSIGGSYETWPNDPLAVAAQTMQKAGVILVVSAGNDGTGGAFSTATPSVSDGAISVASFENTKIPANSFTTSTGARVPYLTAEGAPLPPTTDTKTLALAGPDADGTANTACDQVSPAVSGKAALVSRGTCSFYTKAFNAQKAGATAVVIYNNIPGLSGITAVGDPAITIPVVLIQLSDGKALAAALASSSPVTLTWAAGWITTPNPFGGLVSDFSSYGLAADLSLKPDLGAPGGNILSTFPIEKGSYANLSGTSMAAPHVTGAVALLLQAKPELKGKTTKVRELLQTTGSLAAWSGSPTGGALEPVHRQGGGLIQIATALTTQQTVSPGKISLGEGSAGAKTTTVTLTNASSKPVTYKISKSDGKATLGSYVSKTFFQDVSSTMSAPATVTVPAKGKTTVKVKITPPNAPATAIYGGWVTFTAPGATTLHIPFAGMVGDYQSVKVLTGAGLPSLGVLNPETGNVDPTSGHPVYTMQDFDYPFVLEQLAYPVNDLRIDIFRVGWRGLPTPIAPNYASFVKTGPVGKDPGPVTWWFDGTYNTRGPNGTQFPVKNGTYVITITITKALATGHSPSDYETWVSPTFSINQTT